MRVQSLTERLMSDEAEVRLHAGQFGPDVYADWRTSSLGEITEALEHRLLLRLLGPVKGQRVLDVGCGDGTLALLMARNGAARIAGCDPDARMIARARAQAAAAGIDADITIARAEALPFPDGSFDAVTCVTVLAFAADPEHAVAEMARVLRPGGRLIIGDLGKWSVWAARRRIRGWLGSLLWRGATFRTARQIAHLAEHAGLVAGSVKGAIFFPPATMFARRMAAFDARLGDITTLGAAFIAVAAVKPEPE